MIRSTLAHTKSCTFSIHLNDPHRGGMRRLHGTGFFVSPDGHFITAAHVVSVNGKIFPWAEAMVVVGLGPNEKSYQGFILLHLDVGLDFALFKLDPRSPQFDLYFQSNKLLNPLGNMPFIQISTRVLDDGELVYSFGYPLPVSLPMIPNIATLEKRNPRTTSAIIAGRDETYLRDREGTAVTSYIIDKALNYGNSGGPIVSAETGKVFAFCHGFQTIEVPQPHLTLDPTTMAVRRADPSTGPNTAPVPIMMPSLYSYVPSLGHPDIRNELSRLGVPLAED